MRTTVADIPKKKEHEEAHIIPKDILKSIPDRSKIWFRRKPYAAGFDRSLADDEKWRGNEDRWYCI